jgi:hypothetical protein
MCLGGAGDARAQEHEVGHWLGLGSFNVVSEKQLVRIGDVEFAFEADVTVSLNRKNRGFGFVEVSSAEDVLRLIPVWGTVDRQTGGVVLTLISVVGRQIGPEDIVVAVVQPARGDPGCLIWDFSGTEVSSRALPPPFDAEGTISLSRSGRACEPVDYGQLDAWVAIDAPLQAVQPLPPSTIVGFEAQILLDRNQAARGFLDVYLPRNEPVRYEPIFGAAFPGDDDEGSIRVVVILLLADRQAPLNTNDHVLRATVVEQKTNAVDDCCLIWDLINGETPVNGMFQAIGGIRVEQLNNKYPENR